ncbi:MAG: PqqD family protein [Prevotella sp.]|nr:PqqD family protein [Prevotella sp.]
MADKNARLKLGPNFILHQEDNGDADKKYYALNTESGDIYSINDTVYAFLSLCDGSRNFSEILVDLQAKYKVDLKEMEQDFAPLLEQWLNIKIIQAL